MNTYRVNYIDWDNNKGHFFEDGNSAEELQRRYENDKENYKRVWVEFHGSGVRESSPFAW